MILDGMEFQVSDPVLTSCIHRILASFEHIEAAAWGSHGDDSGIHTKRQHHYAPPGNTPAIHAIKRCQTHTNRICEEYDRLEHRLTQGRAPVGNPFEGQVRRGPRLPKGAK